MISLRLQNQDNEHGILLAPRLFSVSVEVEMSQEDLAVIKPGRKLSIGRDGESVEARFVSAKPMENGSFQMTLAAQREPAFKAIRLGASGALRVMMPDRAEQVEEKKCFVTQRRGDDIWSIQIPCIN